MKSSLHFGGSFFVQLVIYDICNMNKFIFCCSAMIGSYAFCASWGEDLVVNYEFEDRLFDPFNEIHREKNGVLDVETSKRFIDYINKASIETIEENIKKNRNNLELQGYCTDNPSYHVMYMSGCWFDTAYWDSGEFASQLEQYKYLYLAMMLCDENVIEFIYWDHEGDNIDIPFEGNVRDFYFFDDNNEIIYIPNNIKQNGLIKQLNCSSYYEDLKEKFAGCFRKGFIIPENSSDDNYWNLILINDKDEIFYYTGCKNDNPQMDSIIEYINNNKVDIINNPNQIDIVKKGLEEINRRIVKKEQNK